MKEIRILKAKVLKDGKINIVYEKKNNTIIGSWDEYSLACSDRPRPEFDLAMAGLAPHVIDMCELPEEYLERISVKGVSFSYSGEAAVMGATISAGMKLCNSYNLLNLNTPHKASDSYSDGLGDSMQMLSEECVIALQKFTAEVLAYIDGDRAQMTLFGAA